ncbi:hypothetical protein K503DRAFT_857019 [Rhizopogon vinicolor AM-OR11-026]|uniref:Uncharacterized protein n=1 Tax=Rhizopogon vinicolor AM-OR11-026 TaxID=1314800 RepID=A0A1B7MZD1_9AGAM|nr:hypothetical protein K503DRAFT_857019 [Rhizopogon vinicolor AM-OR11-026]
MTTYLREEGGYIKAEKEESPHSPGDMTFMTGGGVTTLYPDFTLHDRNVSAETTGDTCARENFDVKRVFKECGVEWKLRKGHVNPQFERDVNKRDRDFWFPSSVVPADEVDVAIQEENIARHQPSFETFHSGVLYATSGRTPVLVQRRVISRPIPKHAAHLPDIEIPEGGQKDNSPVMDAETDNWLIPIKHRANQDLKTWVIHHLFRVQTLQCTRKMTKQDGLRKDQSKSLDGFNNSLQQTLALKVLAKQRTRCSTDTYSIYWMKPDRPRAAAQLCMSAAIPASKNGIPLHRPVEQKL